MKKRFIGALLALTVILQGAVVVYADHLPSEGSTICGFKVVETGRQKLLDADTVLFEHVKTGGKFMLISNNDTNRVFDIAFRTPGSDTGISHVFEHISLGGSEKYPADVFFNVSSQTLNTFMNAFTSKCHTEYPVASISDKQLLKFADYYMDGVFNPLMDGDTAFRREAWRYTMETPESPLEINGTVYNEMRGNLTGESDSYFNTLKTAFPNSNRSANSGGDPDVIPELTNEDIKAYHEEYYRPSNALVTLYGDTDYREYLKLADSYFSKYDNEEADLSDSAYTPINGHVEKTFSVHGGEESESCVYYAIPCKVENNDDLNALMMAVNMMNLNSSEFSQRMTREFPASSVRIGIDAENTEPIVMVCAANLAAKEAQRLKTIADEMFVYTAAMGVSEAIVDAYAANMIRSYALADFDGVSVAQSINMFWSATGNVNAYYDYLSYISDLKSASDRGDLKNTVSKYLVNPASSVLTINIPDSGMTARKDEELKNMLAEKKAAMSEAEIQKIVADTEKYKQDKDDDKEKIISKINISTVDMLKKDVDNYKPREYKIDEENIDGVRFLTSETETENVGVERLYLDISQLSEEQLLYFRLYTDLIGTMPTEKYSAEVIYNKIARYISGSGKLLPADDALYYTVQWVPINGDEEQTYDTLYQMLFATDTDSADYIKNFIEGQLTQFERSVYSNPDSVIIERLRAQNNDKAAYYAYMNGLEYYNFLKCIREQIDISPEDVLQSFRDVRDVINNRYNASIIYAGNKEGIELNKKYAREFISHMGNEPHGAPSHKLPKPSGSEGIIVSADVNYNALYAPLDAVGADRSGAMYVTQNIVYDKVIMPVLRGIFGAYGCRSELNEYGVGFVSYRDPGLKKTYELYSAMPDMIEKMNLTQEEIDRYIISTYSAHVSSDSDLVGAYEAMRRSIYSTERDGYELLKEIVSTTPEQIKSYAGIYTALAKNGIRTSLGKAGDINAGAELFDSIINPFADGEIVIIIDGVEVETDTAPVILNDITMVPMRAVFERMGCGVEWNDEERSVTVSRDGIQVMARVGESVITVNGESRDIDAETCIIDDRTMVPLRAISEALGCGVEWDGSTRSVSITSA